MLIKKEIVTPHLAESYLNLNLRNRPLSASRVRLYVEVMRRGEWMFNGDPIRFDDSGVLIDGQHRLKAVAVSGVTQSFLVLRGLPNEVFKTIDIGAARSSGDLLSLSDIRNSNVAAAMARMFLLWRATGHPLSSVKEKQPTPSQILAFAEGNALLARATAYAANRKFLRMYMTASVAGFVYLAISTLSEESAVEFLSEIESPQNIASKSVTFMLRERLVADRGNRVKMRKRDKIALILKAYRQWKAGAEVKTLRVRTEGDNAEKDIFRVV
jgi:hypothetical protein